LQAAYDALSSYRFPKFNQVTPVAKDPETPGDALLALELYDEALPELLAKRTVTPNSDEAYTFALLSLRAGFPNRAIRFAEQLWKPCRRITSSNSPPAIFGTCSTLFPTASRF
jgi:hypothetical protein